DERTYPRLHRFAWTPAGDGPPSEHDSFLYGLDIILDGVQARIDRLGGADRSDLKPTAADDRTLLPRTPGQSRARPVP
ncbi:MAG TPA: hypothetical protein VGD91_29895, partial [Trebonia sp.]